MRESYRVYIRAGPHSDSSDPNEPYRFIQKEVPNRFSRRARLSPEEVDYMEAVKENALKLAREMVLKTKKALRLTLEVRIDTRYHAT